MTTTDSKGLPVALVASVPLAITDLPSAVTSILNAVRERRPQLVRFLNSYSISIADGRADYRDLLTGPGTNLPDGAPLVPFMKLDSAHARTRAQQVRGPSFFEHFLEASQDTGVRHLFYGTDETVLCLLRRAVERRFPKAHLVATVAPPFNLDVPAYAAFLADTMGTSKPDVVWVALGTPKQDFVAHAIYRDYGVTTLGVGAAFNFLAGVLPEAPAWIRALHFEWLYRLAQEPRRLWRRYLFGNTRFLWAATKFAFSRRR